VQCRDGRAPRARTATHRPWSRVAQRTARWVRRGGAPRTPAQVFDGRKPASPCIRWMTSPPVGPRSSACRLGGRVFGRASAAFQLRGLMDEPTQVLRIPDTRDWQARLTGIRAIISVATPRETRTSGGVTLPVRRGLFSTLGDSPHGRSGAVRGLRAGAACRSASPGSAHRLLISPKARTPHRHDCAKYAGFSTEKNRVATCHAFGERTAPA